MFGANFCVGLGAVGIGLIVNHYFGNTGLMILLCFWIGIILGRVRDLCDD